MRSILVVLSLFYVSLSFSQTITGRVVDPSKQPVPGVKVENLQSHLKARTDAKGNFTMNVQMDDTLQLSSYGFDTLYFIVTDDAQPNIKLNYSYTEIEEAIVERKRLEVFDVGILPPIKGVQITTGTNAVIALENLSGAKSTGNARELFARIPGLNIWENDGAGIQIGIGGRGLSPNRAANFNTRQNGYDISADALGYPESYYTPPTEALSSIEIVRGSASLQFGTQFGGLLNFVIKEPTKKSPFEFTSRNTLGSFGYFGTFNRISGTQKRWSYQVYHQYKSGAGYRQNSSFNQNQLFAELGYTISERMKVRLEYTHMDYLAKQAGGLSDFQFEENPLNSYRDRNWFKVNWNVLALHFDFEITNNTVFNLRSFGMMSQRQTLGFLGKITQADPGGNREMIAGDFMNGGSEARLLHKYNFALNDTKVRAAILLGARYYQGNTTSLQGTATDGKGADFRFRNPNDLENSSFAFPSQNLAFFAENIFFLGPNWTVNGGARLEVISSSSKGYYRGYKIHPVNFDTLDVYKIEDEKTVNRVVPLFGAGTSYKFNRSLTSYLNVTQNYRAINFSDIRISNPNIVIDSAIRDEYGATVEVGLRGTLGKLWTYDLAGFYIFYGDKIGLAPKAGTTFKERTNIGDAVNTGVELYTEMDLIHLLADSSKYKCFLFANVAYIQAKYIRSKEPNFVGKNVEYVAPLIARGGLKISSKKFTLQYQLSYTSEQFSDASNSVIPSGDAVIGLVPSYLVSDVSARFDFPSNFRLEVGVNNLTNTNYFTRRATGYPGPGILPSDGRNFYVTLQFQLAVKRK